MMACSNAMVVLTPVIMYSPSERLILSIASRRSLPTRDQLADHGVVVGRDGVAGIDMAVHPRAAPARRVIHLHPARARAEIVEGVLGVDAAFDGVAAQVDVALRQAQRLAHGDGDLEFDQVNAA